MMEAAHLLDSHDSSVFRWLYRTRLRRVLGERKMRSGFVIVRREQLDLPVESRFVEDNHVIEALTPDSADHALDVS